MFVFVGRESWVGSEVGSGRVEDEVSIVSEPV